MPLRRTPIAMTAAACAVALMPLSLIGQAAAQPSTPTVEPATAPVVERAAKRYRATVTRTKHGIPHVVADDWGSLGFGHGYATAETNLCNLADTLVTARGERSRWFGPEERYEDQVTLSATNLQSDTLFTDIRNRKVVEELLADPDRGPGKQARRMVKGYTAGVNAYIRAIGGADGVKDPACRGAGYIRPDATPLDLWYGVYAANLLASTGVFAHQIADAAPPTPDDPGLPEVPLSAKAPFGEVPEVLPDREELLTGLGKDPSAPFGSNATAVGGEATTTGRGMILGNPHFPWRGRYRFAQAHLTIPGEYDVAGASLIGSPVINIGWNDRVAWSHTVSTAYRFTPYEYRYVALPDGTVQYLTDSGPKELERRVVEVTVRNDDGTLGTVEEDVYRTPQGYVTDSPDVLMGWSPMSFFAIRDANAEHLRTVDTFLEMGKARSVKDLIRRQDAQGGMPWVNTTAADRRGGVVYADHSVVPNVPDALAEQCMTPIGLVLNSVAGLPGLDGTRADSSCAWGTDEDAGRPGVFGPANLPVAYRRDWLANANDSYWLPNPEVRLEGYAGIIGCEQCERSLRTRMVYRYVLDRLAGEDGLAKGRKVSPRTLRLFQHTNRVFGAELAREDDDLQDVCAAAEGGEACEVLADWDGLSDTTSVGTHLFQEFWKRVPAGAWEVPFDAADPMGTPRDLDEGNADVVTAMSDALAFLQEKGIAPATPWGELQVAGDEGAPRIPIGGGDATAGNANAIASRMAAANLDALSAVSYGSSHIQAIAFGDRGRVNARTILTYSQATDTTSPFSADQTRLFSRERWVTFPFTAKQVRKQQISRTVVSAARR